MAKESLAFVIGGKLAPSYKGALSEAVTEAQTASRLMQKKIHEESKRAAGYKKDSAEYAASIARKEKLEAKLIKVQEAGAVKVAQERAAITARENAARLVAEEALLAKKLAATEAELAAEVAAQKVADMERMTSIAKGNGAAVHTGGHGGGGISGIIRESIVIVRELAAGRGLGRVAASVTLLGQYMGVLGKIFKTTASEAVSLSVAATKLSIEMNTAARAATLAATTEKEVVAAQKLATAATAQEAVATKAATEAQIALNSARFIGLGPLGWVLIAGAAVAAVLVGWAMHMHKLAVEARNLHDFMGPLKADFLSMIDAMKDAEQDQQSYLKFLSDLKSKANDASEALAALMDKIDAQAEADIELMRAQGKSEAEIEKRKEKAEKDKLDATKAAKTGVDNEVTANKAKLATAHEDYQHFLKTKGKDDLDLKAQEDERREAVKEVQKTINELNSAGKKTASRTESRYNPTTHQMETVDGELRAYGRDDEVEITVNGKKMKMSQAKAEQLLTDTTNARSGISNTKSEKEDGISALNDAVRDGTATSKDMSKEINKLTAQQSSDPTKMDAAKLRDQKKEEKKEHAAHKDLAESAREKSGIYSSVYSMKMHSTAEKSLKELQKIAKNTGAKGRGGHAGAANYGDGPGVG